VVRCPAARVLATSLLGALALLGVVVLQLRGRPLVHLLQPGAAGPSAPLLARDFPHLAPPPGAGNDGQLFYAIARDPLHPTAVARLLDRPRYRLQRPGYPLLAWALHPGGGGDGLVRAMLAVNVLAAALAAAALAWWALRRGRSARWGLLALALPGAFMAMRISCADLLAGAMALLAAVLLLDGRWWPAAVVGAAAAVTKETSLILFVAVAVGAWRDRPRAMSADAAEVARRRSRTLAAVVAPAVVIAAVIWLALLVTFPHAGRQYGELGAPLRGLTESARYWRDTHDWKPALTVIVSIGVAVAALRARRWSPFAVAVTAYLAVAAFQSMGTLAFWTSAPRTLYPLGLCSIAALLDRRRDAADGPAVTAPLPARA
jgi:hypothetical protein